uniref:Uncharacterized protein n=1 Tax=Anopheles melas TaxID=34690 RepID=A0A182U462_9DIPT
MDRTAFELVHLPVDPLMVDGAVVRNLAAAAPPQPLAHPTYPALVLKVAMLLYDHARRSALRQVGLQILHEAIAHGSCGPPNAAAAAAAACCGLLAVMFIFGLEMPLLSVAALLLRPVVDASGVWPINTDVLLLVEVVVEEPPDEEDDEEEDGSSIRLASQIRIVPSAHEETKCVLSVLHVMQIFPIGTEAYPLHRLPTVGKDAEQLPAGDAPQPHGQVGRTGGQIVPVRVECHRVDVLRVADVHLQREAPIGRP